MTVDAANALEGPVGLGVVVVNVGIEKRKFIVGCIIFLAEHNGVTVRANVLGAVKGKGGNFAERPTGSRLDGFKIVHAAFTSV